MSKRLRVFVRADDLAVLMARRNISQNGLARALHLSSAYVSQLVRGSRCPSPKLRCELQAFLQIENFDDIFRIEEVGHV